jgi:hypothetical protein
MTASTLAFAAVLIVWALLAVMFARRLRRLTRDLSMVMRETVAADEALLSEVARLRADVAELRASERVNARDICRIGDALSDHLDGG